MERFMKQTSGALLLFAVVSLLATACGGDEITEAGDGEYASPLAEYMGFDWGNFDEEEAEARFAEEQRQVNESVVACMAAEGFDYTPENMDQMISFEGDLDPEGLEHGSDEWVAKYGFGISTQSFPQEMLGPELVGFNDEMMMEEEGSYEDPNAAYVESLSEADHQAFYAVLYGEDDGPDISEDMSEEEMQAAVEEWDKNNEPTGCMNIAWEEFSGGGADQAFWEEFGSELESMWERMESHPKILAVEKEVAECVSGKGYAYTTLQEVNNDLHERMEPLYSAIYEQGDFVDITEDEAAAMSEEELDDLYGHPEINADVKAELAEIQSDEIAIAVAVNECGGGFDANQEVYNEVRVELEQEFVDANKDALDAYRAAQG